MSVNTKKIIISVFVVLFILTIDQIVKIWIKTNMFLYQSIDITSWFKIYFEENNGMAFGIEAFGKLFLTLFRLVAIAFIIYYINRIIKNGIKTGFIICISLILAGAFGNIIDSVFYGVIFQESTTSQIAQIVPFNKGYSSLFHGKVVDMFFFPLIKSGNDVFFFKYVFNIADSAISVGATILIIFYRKTLFQTLSKPKKSD